MPEFIETVIGACAVMISFGIFLFLAGKGFQGWKEIELKINEDDD